MSRHKRLNNDIREIIGKPRRAICIKPYTDDDGYCTEEGNPYPNRLFKIYWFRIVHRVDFKRLRKSFKIYRFFSHPHQKKREDRLISITEKRFKERFIEVKSWETVPGSQFKSPKKISKNF